MKRSDLPMFADIAFYTVCAFVFSLCVMRYYRLPFALSASVAALFALAAGGAAFLLLYSGKRRRALNKKQQEARDALLLHLALEKPERVRAQLLSALVADGSDARCEGERLSLDGVPLVPLFTMEPANADAVALLLREFGGTPFRIFCNALTPDAEKLLASFSVKADCKDEIYALFERTKTIPDPLICGELPRKTAKQKLRRSFSKANARPFFVSGLLLMLMSLFTLFPLYYVISGGLLLLCAVAVRLFGYA